VDLFLKIATGGGLFVGERQRKFIPFDDATGASSGKSLSVAGFGGTVPGWINRM
jgi:hypothetical protein